MPRNPTAVYTDMHAMLDAEKPDGVIVCVGPQGHPKLAIDVMRAGYPVYTEKPPSTTATEALAVARVAKQTGQMCMTAFKKRYAIAYDHAKQWIDKFPPEDRLSLSVDYAARTYGDGKDVKNRPFLLDFTVHLIDLVGYLFGDVKRVFCFSKFDFAYAVSVEFTCGAVGSFNFATGRSFGIPTEEVEISLAGGNFMTVSNSSRYRITEDEKPTAWREPCLFTSAGDSGLDTGHAAELAAFVKFLQDGTRPRSQIAESYKSMVLFEAIAESATTNQIIDIQYEEV